MRRSFSTSCLATTLVAAGLALGPVPGRAAESLEQSLETELDVAQKNELYLLLDIEAATLEIKSRGFVLDEVPVHRVGIRTWSPLLGDGDTVDLPSVVTVTRSATQRREIIIAGHSEATGESDSARPSGLAVQPATGSYGCVLDNGWLLEIRDHGEGGGFWSRLWSELSNPFATRAAKRGSNPTLVVELATDDAERLRHLFRRDTPMLIR